MRVYEATVIDKCAGAEPVNGEIETEEFKYLIGERVA